MKRKYVKAQFGFLQGKSINSIPWKILTTNFKQVMLNSTNITIGMILVGPLICFCGYPLIGPIKNFYKMATGMLT